MDILFTLLDTLFLSNSYGVLTRTCLLHSVYSLAVLFDLAVFPRIGSQHEAPQPSQFTLSHTPRVLFLSIVRCLVFRKFRHACSDELSDSCSTPSHLGSTLPLCSTSRYAER